MSYRLPEHGVAGVVADQAAQVLEGAAAAVLSALLRRRVLALGDVEARSRLLLLDLLIQT